MKVSPFIIFVVGIGLLIALFFIFKPQNSSLSDQSSVTQSTPKKNEKKKNPQPESNKKSFSITIKNGEIVSGEKTVSVIQGENIMIELTTDVEDEIHLHGYDISVRITPHDPAVLQFTADKTGRFSYELEHAGIELGAIEVNPK